MKMKAATIAVISTLLLQACAGIPKLKDTTDTLTVYPDNRVGYILSSSGGGPARAWMTQDQILAMRFKNRLINAKDMAFVDVKYTGKRYTPLSVNVGLTSGERLNAEIADWGSEMHVEGVVEWIACTKDKTCEYLDHRTNVPRFPGFRTILTVVTDADIYNEAQRLYRARQPVTAAKDLATHSVADALPLGSRSYRMEFQDINSISNTQASLEKARKHNEDVAKCVSEYVSKEDRERREHEEKVLRSKPSAQDLRLLQAWKLSLRTGFSQMMTAEMACK